MYESFGVSQNKLVLNWTFLSVTQLKPKCMKTNYFNTLHSFSCKHVFQVFSGSLGRSSLLKTSQLVLKFLNWINSSLEWWPLQKKSHSKLFSQSKKLVSRPSLLFTNWNLSTRGQRYKQFTAVRCGHYKRDHCIPAARELLGFLFLLL
jgi:hypothetical protein